MTNMVRNKKIAVLLMLSFIFIKCNTYKMEIHLKGGESQAIENCIIDYYHTHKKYIKEYDSFYIRFMDDEKSNYYHINILPQRNKISIRKEHNIDSIVTDEFFPTNYKRYNDKLFIWYDEDKVLQRDVLDALDKNKLLDSIWLRYDLGIYKDDWDNTAGKYPSLPTVTIDETIEGVDYLICKNKINIYRKKIKGVYRPYDNNLPKPKCN
jgi:hypothetical protein